MVSSTHTRCIVVVAVVVTPRGRCSFSRPSKYAGLRRTKAVPRSRLAYLRKNSVMGLGTMDSESSELLIV